MTPPSTPPTPPTGPDPAALAGLARQIDTLSRQVTAVQDTPGRIDSLAGTVQALTEFVDGLQVGGEPVPNKPRPSWIAPAKALTEETAGQLLADLLDWVDRVFLAYPDGAEALPGCWLWHPHAVEELLWLRHAHDEAYAGPKASGGAVGDWHDRYRPGVAKRLNTALNGCSVERHAATGRPRDPIGDARAKSGAAPLGPLVEQMALWWSVNRDAEPPQPTPEQLLTPSLSRTASQLGDAR